MLHKIAASVAASKIVVPREGQIAADAITPEAIPFRGSISRNASSSEPGDSDSKNSELSCECGSTKFWLPVGRKDSPCNYRCVNCSPFASPKMVQRTIYNSAPSDPLASASDDRSPQFGPYVISAREPACKRCSGALISMSEAGYCCAMCHAPIHDRIASFMLWGAA